jgi:hypothetical protein
MMALRSEPSYSTYHGSSRREDLYKDFSRMRALSSQRTISCADKVMRTTIGTYFAPNRTIPEHGSMKSRTGVDPLNDFAEAVREELQAFPGR